MSTVVIGKKYAYPDEGVDVQLIGVNEDSGTFNIKAADGREWTVDPSELEELDTGPVHESARRRIAPRSSGMSAPGPTQYTVSSEIVAALHDLMAPDKENARSATFWAEEVGGTPAFIVELHGAEEGRTSRWLLLNGERIRLGSV